MSSKKDILTKWHSIKFPSGYSNPDYFARSLKQKGFAKNKSVADIKDILEKDLYYQSSRAVKKKLVTRHDLSSYFSIRMELDVMDMGKRFRDRFGSRYALVLEDLFSKTVFIEGVESRNTKDILTAFKHILNRFKSPYTVPENLDLDKAGEFFNPSFKNFAQEKNIHLRFLENRNKAKVRICPKVDFKTRSIHTFIFFAACGKKNQEHQKDFADVSDGQS